MSLKHYEFGTGSEIVSFRYDSSPELRGEFRGCVITIRRSGDAGDLISFRLKGFAGAISDMLGGTDISIRESDDPNLEFSRFAIRFCLDGTHGTTYCAECCEVDG